MASLNDRLTRLEAKTTSPYEAPLPAYLTLYLKQVENVRREGAGLGASLEPLTPEEQRVDEEGTRWFLEEYIPQAKLRELGGSPETLAMIDELEEHAKVKELPT